MLSTVHALIGELSTRSPVVAGMQLAQSVADGQIDGQVFNLANSPDDLSKVASWVEKLVTALALTCRDAELLVRSLLNERNFYGSYCELGAYGWLTEHDVSYRAQVPLGSTEVLNPNGATIDGKFIEVDAYFDIKGMGFLEYVVETFRRKVEVQLPGLRVMIDGSMDIAVKDVDKHAFSQLGTVVQVLRGGKPATIDQLGWIVRAHSGLVSTSIQETNPYRLAMENRFFPFKTSGQFTRRHPFVLVFAYTSKFHSKLPINFSGSTDITLRSMARRAFLELSSCPAAASAYDSSAPAGITLGDASRLLSAMLFINLDDSEDARMYLNPRASHRLQSRDLAHLFDFAPLPIQVDDFEFDDY